MEGTLIAFTVPTGKDKTKSSTFAKAFYGQNTSSHRKKYRYHRHGLLDDIPHNKLIRGVIIIQPEHAEQIIEFLDQHSAQHYLRMIKLTEEDHKALCLPLK